MLDFRQLVNLYDVTESKNTQYETSQKLHPPAVYTFCLTGFSQSDKREGKAW